MKNLYEASNAAEAHMLLDLLTQQGISAQIQGEHLQGAVGGLPVAGLVRLVVEDDAYVPARALIDQWETREATPERVPSSTQSSRSRGFLGFVLGLIFGVAGVYIAYKTPVTIDGTDYNRDGLLDEKWTYSPTGRPLKLEIDRNLDHKVDYISQYDSRGLVESAESDDDFDGVFETKLRFRDGNVELNDSDTDNDGFPDMRWYYKNGVLESIEYVNPSTGRPLRIEHYKLGRLLFADVDENKDGKLDTRQTYSSLAEITSKQPLSK